LLSGTGELERCGIKQVPQTNYNTTKTNIKQFVKQTENNKRTLPLEKMQRG
jgi:hypothetical protein